MNSIPTNGAWDNLKHVKYLSLRCCVDVDNFSAIKEMQSLVVLDVNYKQVGDELLFSMAQKLNGVDIGYCEKITKEGASTFFRQQSCLTSIGLAGLGDIITHEVLSSLWLYNIQFLDLSECNITANSLCTNKPHLRELSLQGTGHITDILDLLTLNIQTLTKLRVLEIGPIPECLLSKEEEPVDEILALLPLLEELQILALINYTIRNTGISSPSTIP